MTPPALVRLGRTWTSPTRALRNIPHGAARSSPLNPRPPTLQRISGVCGNWIGQSFHDVDVGICMGAAWWLSIRGTVRRLKKVGSRFVSQSTRFPCGLGVLGYRRLSFCGWALCTLNRHSAPPGQSQQRGQRCGSSGATVKSA